MGIQVRDERQMKALTGLSQAQFDDLLPVFSDIYGVTQQKHYEEGVASGTRRRKPGGGTKGKWHNRWHLYAIEREASSQRCLCRSARAFCPPIRRRSLLRGLLCSSTLKSCAAS